MSVTESFVTESKTESQVPPTINVVCRIEVKKEKLQEFLEAAKPLVRNTNKEAGCIRYNLHQEAKDETKFVIFEEWKNQECLSKHLTSDHVKDFQKHKECCDEFNIYVCGGPLVEV